MVIVTPGEKKDSLFTMFTNVINGSDAFVVLAEQWDDLARQGMTNTPFQTLAYQRSWWRHLHPQEATLHTVVVYGDENELVAIACFYRTIDGVIYFNGCVEETDYLDLITTRQYAEAAWAAVFDSICMDTFPDWTALDFCNVPEASLTRQILRQLAQQRGFSFQEAVQEVCPVISLPDTFEAYLNSIDSKQRREIRRKLRRAAAAGVQLVQVGSEDNLDEAIETFLELLQKSTYEKRDWLNEGRRAVFYETAVAAMAAGMLQLLFIEVEGQRAAALFNFDYNDRIWVYNSGLDPTTFGNLSLGVVLTAKAIENAVDQKRSTFDFLRGNETYKYRFGAQDTHIYQLQIRQT